MGPEVEKPQQPADEPSQLKAVSSTDYWDVYVKVTVRADSKEEAIATVEEVLNEAAEVISYEHWTGE